MTGKQKLCMTKRYASTQAILDRFEFPAVNEGSPLPGLLDGICAKYAIPSSVYADIGKLEEKLPQYRLWREDAETSEPRHVQYDHWCRRVDRLVLANGWEELKKEVAREGLIHYGYHSASAEVGRMHQFMKLFIASPYMAMVTCPTAMTDGAAMLCRMHGLDDEFDRLTTRDPQQFWMSGQWMTERPGGSDVGNTETTAELGEDAEWKVSGLKWFSSATDADIAFLLARTKHEGDVVPGSKGLSLYLAKIRKENGELNNIAIHRLKNKFGTKSLPTAELILDKVPARLVGEPYKGVKNITPILNVTRLHAALGVASYVHLSLNLAKSYAASRVTFGKLLKDHILHGKTLQAIESRHRGSTLLIFHMVHLLGRSEMGDQKAKTLLRMLTPMAKMYVCKTGTHDIMECMEAMGGQGYMEETGIGMLLRDGIVNTIWEGATNVLALDLLRVFDAKYFISAVQELLDHKSIPAELKECSETIEHAVNLFLSQVSRLPTDELEGQARDLAFSMARIYIGALLVEHANSIQAHPDYESSRVAAQAWARQLNAGPLLSHL